ncbi:flagellar hook-length control protein FliK [Arsukibacterium sp.]|uniref:flagellar hook-length control protein FliK n=1 Tax=Arsukibacterium sp. TaxID=1977258 RepID=UPI002FDB621C
MNQINLDKLLQISIGPASAVNAGELKLALNQLYNARLQLLGQGQAQLTVLTPQGPLNVPLNREQLAQLKLTPAQANSSAPHNTSLTSSSHSQTHAAKPEIVNTTANHSPAHSSGTADTNKAVGQHSVNLTNNHSKVLSLQLQFSELPGKALQLQLIQQGATVQVPLTQAQAQQLLMSILSLSLSSPAAEPQLPVRLNPATAQILLAVPGLPAQPLLQLTAARNLQLMQLFAPALAHSSAQTATPGVLTLQLTGSADGQQLKLSFASSSATKMQSVEQTVTQKGASLSATLQSSATIHTRSAAGAQVGHSFLHSGPATTLAEPSKNEQASIRDSLLLNRAEQRSLLQQLLPLLPATMPAKLKHAGILQLGTLNLPLPAQLTASPSLRPALSDIASQGLTVQLQLEPPQQERWALQWRPLTQLGQLQLAQSAFNRPLQLQMPAQADSRLSMSAEPIHYRAEQAWRQLLPLITERPASLSQAPELPNAINQIFNLLRSVQPGGNKVLALAELLPQLQASIHFQPLQAQPNSQTAAGALAVAIQLLLGQLHRAAPAATGSTLAQRLTQQLTLLDPAQNALLLRQLASHSSVLQQAQLVNVEQQGPMQQWLIPLALQHQGQSQISQILLEERDNPTENDEEAAPVWQLTMKFDLGSFGPLLAKARLSGQQLSLQFYTEQAATLQLANKFLPLLTERCTAQGLIVTEAACQLGKIPESLLPRRTSLVQLKV